MKKVFLAAAIAVSAVAIASSNNTSSASVKSTFQDTLPGKSDTTKKDTIPTVAFNVNR